jgi:hypothetical protein
MIPAVTQRVLSFLAEAGSYAHHPSQVRMVQTHASWVFIASPFVYKIKKPVNLGFLDFSTLELRHADCEVTLNRRLADDVYLGVEPICELGGYLRFGREGAIVEWAVKMREMDERCFLKELIRAGKAGAPEMERIVEKLRRFYDAQPHLPPGEIESANDRLQHNAEDNFASARAFIGTSLSQQVLMRSPFTPASSSRGRKRCWPHAWQTAGYVTATAICILITSTSRQTRFTSTTASSSTLISGTSTWPVTLPFLRWISISTAVRNSPPFSSGALPRFCKMKAPCA